MLFKKSSSDKIESFYCNTINKTLDLSMKSSGSHLFFFFFFLLFLILFLFSFHCLFWLFLRFQFFRNNINGSVNHYDKGIQRKFVERVNLVEFIHHEENQSTSTGCRSIGFWCIINHDLSLLSNLYLFFNFSRYFLWIFQVLNQCNVF